MRSERIGRQSGGANLYKGIIWLLVALLFIALISCAAGSNEKRGESASEPRPTMRLLLGGNSMTDSAFVVTDFFVDQVIRQVLDSISRAQFLTLNYRDSLVLLARKEGKKGIEIAELGSRLDLDGVIMTRVARFGSVLGVETRIVDPRSGAPIYRDLAFSVIRHRDSAGTMLLGPALYDAVRRSLGRYFEVPHTKERPIATEPLIITGIEIPNDTALGRIRRLRPALSHETITALVDFVNLQFPELIGFDMESRNRVYETVNVGAVENYMAVGPSELRALYGVGIERILTGKVSILSTDSLRLRLELRHVVSSGLDTLIEYAQMTVPKLTFETSTTEEDFVLAMIDLSEPLLVNESERLRSTYAARTTRAEK